ncbi:hypothetical protein BI347_13030 [Chromobacterium sphagni]|uniref:DUF4180 domain-containing protein n=1 Tax=Chromobacterium sphagni TaxID=1903179 RepID=A0A1S1X4F0_9NEIS|nr:DUF4180 domain-containing protein [Chromobacterium sphagni]OHX14324.1 hypothetical protein BI347_13030 [Chromobacterium sphagni]
MDCQVLQWQEMDVVECLSSLDGPRRATDLVAACAERGSCRLLLDAPALPAAFFAFDTCFAGELLQMLRNYRLRTEAAWRDAECGKRYAEHLREARRARHSRLFDAREQALAWLELE